MKTHPISNSAALTIFNRRFYFTSFMTAVGDFYSVQRLFRIFKTIFVVFSEYFYLKVVFKMIIWTTFILNYLSTS